MYYPTLLCILFCKSDDQNPAHWDYGKAVAKQSALLQRMGVFVFCFFLKDCYKKGPLEYFCGINFLKNVLSLKEF